MKIRNVFLRLIQFDSALYICSSYVISIIQVGFVSWLNGISILFIRRGRAAREPRASDARAQEKAQCVRCCEWGRCYRISWKQSDMTKVYTFHFHASAFGLFQRTNVFLTLLTCCMFTHPPIWCKCSILMYALQPLEYGTACTRLSKPILQGPPQYALLLWR